MRRVAIAIAVFVLIALQGGYALGADVVITAIPNISGGWPTGLTLTHIDDFNIGIDWTKGFAAPEPPGTASTVINTMIRVRWGEVPADRTDGYQVYYGDLDSIVDDAIDLTSLTMTPYYCAWTESVFYDAGGDIISNVWQETGTWEEANFMSISWFFAVLGLLALGLTIAMFMSRNAMLGFPAAIFWALFGGYAYTLSVTTWDIYYIVAFASILGMVSFTALGAWGLREKRDTIADVEMEKAGDEQYIDEGGNGHGDADRNSRLVSGVRKRAVERRTKGLKPKLRIGR